MVTFNLGVVGLFDLLISISNCHRICNIMCFWVLQDVRDCLRRLEMLTTASASVGDGGGSTIIFLFCKMYTAHTILKPDLHRPEMDVTTTKSLYPKVLFSTKLSDININS